MSLNEVLTCKAGAIQHQYTSGGKGPKRRIKQAASSTVLKLKLYQKQKPKTLPSYEQQGTKLEKNRKQSPG